MSVDKPRTKIRPAVGLMLVVGVVVAALVVPATAGRKKVLERVDRRFDHDAHAVLVDAKLGKPVGCADACHTLDQSQSSWRRAYDDKKEHERCYVNCHGGFKHKMTTNRRELKGITGRTCFPCHGKQLKYRPRDDNLGKVAAATEIDHVAAYSHRKHITPQASTGKQCEACHGKFGDDSGQQKGTLVAGHDHCSGCHGKAVEPTMTDCANCHLERDQLGDKAPVVKPRKASPYAVSGGFSHKSHAQIRRVGKSGRTCLTCHANIGESKADDMIPLPTMQTCYKSCHDGKKAFSVTGTRCTECHKRRAP